MKIDAKTVMKLRKATGAGMMECKKALVEAEGDFDKATDIIRTRAGKKAAKKAGRATGEGIIGSYTHHNHKLLTVVELMCETDFVARNDKFKELARGLAMHVAAISPPPEYMSREDVPADVVERERAIYTEQVKDKPEQIREKIVDGKLNSFFAERCLLDQPYAMDQTGRNPSVSEVLAAATAELGENMKIGRYFRIVLGEKAED